MVAATELESGESAGDDGGPWLAVLVYALVVSVLPGGALLLYADAPPSEHSLRYATIATVDEPTTDGFAALGIAAHPDDDSATVGRRRYEAMRRYLVEHERQREAPEMRDYPKRRRIDPPRASCQFMVRDCLEAILPPGGDATTLAETHAVLLRRHDAWLSADDVRPPIRRIGEGWDVEGTVLTGAHRLALLLAAEHAAGGDAPAALSSLERYVERLRVRLAEADSLLEKMVVMRMLSYTIDVVVRVGAQADGPAPAPFDALSVRERSMARPFAREFEFARDGAVNVLSRQSYDRPAPTAVFHAARLVLDVGATANWVAADLRSQERLGELSRDAFRAARARGPAPSDRRARLSAANIVGSWMLGSGASPDYAKYIAYLHALDEKMALANHLIAHAGLQNGALPDRLDDIDGLPGGARLDVAGRRLCARDPIAPSKPEVGCVPLHGPPGSSVRP